MARGKLIVMEGLDGSGKATQTGLLCQYLESRGRRVRHIEFPDYREPSSALVKMYLNKEFGSNPGDVNAYAASSFLRGGPLRQLFAVLEKGLSFRSHHRGGPVHHFQRGVSDGKNTPGGLE